MTLNEAKEFSWWLGFKIAIFIVGVVLIGTFLNLFNMGKDDTDPPGIGKRSGLSLYTDHKTGCQYLAVYKTGMTPRRNTKGEHEGCGR